MKIAVLGGAGVAGRYTLEALRAAGHEASSLSRSTGVDVATGIGLTAGLLGMDAVVDVTNVVTMKRAAAEAFFEASATNVSRAAAEAGVGHIVALSIVGIDGVPFGYYQGKVRQEQALRQSSVPVSILRATQFHEFARQLLDRSKRRTVLVPRWRVQPVAAREVGEALAVLAVGSPHPMTDIAGPKIESMAELVRKVAQASGQKRRVWEVRLPGKAGTALVTGRNTSEGPACKGRQSFDTWLDQQPWGT